MTSVAGFALIACTPGVPSGRDHWLDIAKRAGAIGVTVAEVHSSGSEIAHLVADIRARRGGRQRCWLVLTVSDPVTVRSLRTVYGGLLWQVDAADSSWNDGSPVMGGDVVTKVAGDTFDRYATLLAWPGAHGPTADEQAMYFAAAARLRSSTVRGQAGAALCDETGDLIAVGSNEVPRAGGGQYWDGDPYDGRDRARFGYDYATAARWGDFMDTLDWLVERAMLSAAVRDAIAALGVNALPGDRLPQVLKGEARGRNIHAEEAAILSAARRGVRLGGSRAYTTQPPCHLCLRHLIGAGVRTIQYLPGRASQDLVARHGDALRSDGVSLEQFTGITPTGYERLFGRLSGRTAGVAEMTMLLEESLCRQSAP